MNRFFSNLLVVFCILNSLQIRGEEWPQVLGPNRNGSAESPALAQRWKAEGPPVAWQKKVGEGFAGPVISGGSLVLFHRLGDEEIAECFGSKTGTIQWKYSYPSTYRDDYGSGDGPRSTPAIHDGKVYTLGPDGDLHCISLKEGRKIWAVQVRKQFSSAKGFFGMACSPLVVSNALILNIGGAQGAGIVAFDRHTGKVMWKATDDEASYASPITGTVAGKQTVFVFTRSGLVKLDPFNGQVQFKFPWRSPQSASVNAATPLLIGDLLFLSASYDVGAILLKVNERSANRVWSGDDVLSNHFATSVHQNGYLFGFHGRHESGPSLRCVELKTGKVKWTEESLGAGHALGINGQLLILTEKGELILAGASPEKFQTLARAQVLGFGARAIPAVADGFFYARDKSKLYCVDLRAPSVSLEKK